MYWELISLEEIISSEDMNFLCIWKYYCREWGQYLMQFDAPEETCNGTAS